MNNFIEVLQQKLDAFPDWLALPALILLSLVIVLVLRLMAMRALNKIAAKLPEKVAGHFLYALRGPLSIIILVLFMRMLAYVFALEGGELARFNTFNDSASKTLVIIAFLLFVDRFSTRAIDEYRGSGFLRNSRGLVSGFVRLSLLVLGILIVLSTLGISITPIIASLGITSLAVALALQPTLENFFSGLQLIADKPVRVGDFIELDSGEQGFVEKIGWRSTWIRMLPNNIVIMPNSAMAQSKIINYYYPEKELSVPVEVGVHYSSDLEHVERVTLEVAREILSTHKWGVASYEPFVLYHTFDSSSINFTVMLRVQEYFNRFFVKSAFIKALHARYAQEGIVIPFPISAINTEQERAKFFENDGDG